MMSDHFPKISEDSPKIVRRSDKRCQTFSENSEDCRGLTKKTRRCLDVKYNLRPRLQGSENQVPNLYT